MPKKQSKKKAKTKARTLEAKTTETVNEVSSTEVPAAAESKTAAIVEVVSVESADNEYNVPVDQWAKWNKAQRSRFNEVYSAMKISPSLFTHPDAVTIPADQWITICWNAAWVAAGA